MGLVLKISEAHTFIKLTRSIWLFVFWIKQIRCDLTGIFEMDPMEAENQVKRDYSNTYPVPAGSWNNWGLISEGKRPYRVLESK